MNLSGLDLDHLSAVAITALPSVVAILIAALVIHFLVNRLLTLLARRTHFTQTELSPIHRASKWTIIIAALVLSGFDAIWSFFTNWFLR